jgi:UDP-N-acetylglucosamine/UDP-N-acetylgalactosamine diphosphorylase
MEKPAALYECLSKFGQEHLLDFWSDMSPTERSDFQRQLEQIDFIVLRELVCQQDSSNHWSTLADRAEPPRSANNLACAKSPEQLRARSLGEKAMAQGEVAAILVAGGQGTRLGFDLPKGMLPIGPISQRTLFEVLVDILRARIQTHGRAIPLLIMTSPATHVPTVQYFADNRYLGLDERDVEIICQGTMPAVDRQSGRVLLAEKNQISLSPDGHGGMLKAIAHSGALARLQSRGIKHLFYGQIDNPLVQLCDPMTLGYHIAHGSEMTTQVIRKSDPMQRVGNVVSVDGRTQVIEYSELPESVARQRCPDGSLRLWAGNIAVHVFAVAFLQRVQDQATALPFHRALKKVPYIDRQGNRITPAHVNAIKFERFIFDLMPSAAQAVVVEIDPAEGFSPVKNGLDAPTENVRTAQAAMVAQHARWLRECGAHVGDSVPIEIHPRFALDCEQLQRRIPPGQIFDQPTYLRP